MFEEANRANFGNWTTQLVNGGLQNMTTIRQLEWRNRLTSSMFDLLKRLQQCLNLEEDILISSFCYMKRAVSKGLKLPETSVYKFAVVCIFIAQKFYSDFRYEVEDFSISSGVTIKDILKLETVTLEFLEYNLILSERDYYGIMLFGKI